MFSHLYAQRILCLFSCSWYTQGRFSTLLHTPLTKGFITKQPYKEVLTHVSDTILGACYIFGLWAFSLYKMLSLLAMSLEHFPRCSLTPPPCSLFNRRGAVHYFPSFGPNLRYYLPLTSLKNSVWFALSTGGGDDGHQVNPWVTMSRTGMLQTHCGPLIFLCVSNSLIPHRNNCT